jgi:hypothetical protein
MGRFVRCVQQTVLQKANSEEDGYREGRPGWKSGSARCGGDGEQTEYCDPHQPDNEEEAWGATMQRSRICFREKIGRYDELSHKPTAPRAAALTVRSITEEASWYGGATSAARARVRLLSLAGRCRLGPAGALTGRFTARRCMSRRWRRRGRRRSSGGRGSLDCHRLLADKRTREKSRIHRWGWRSALRAV